MCSAGHLRECYDIYSEGYDAWPVNLNGPSTGNKVPWVPSSFLQQLKPNVTRKEPEALTRTNHWARIFIKRASKPAIFSKMRETWSRQGDLIDEASWGKHNYSCSKSEEDRRRFPKLRFGAECVTPRDLPKTIVVLKAKKVKSEKISVREFGYLSDATLVAKHNFGDFQVSQECNSRWRVWPQQRRQP